MSDRIEELQAAYDNARLVSEAADAAFDGVKSFKAVCDAAKAALGAAKTAAAAKAALEAAERESRA